jgi:transcriptional regulator with XRE-family HTH domain
MFKEGRKYSGLTREEAAFRINVAPRTLSKYESGEIVPAPDIVVSMSREYGRPEMTQRYCRDYCPIGQKYSYIHLNNVSTNLSDIWMQLELELEEALVAVRAGRRIVVNKRGPEDFAPEQWDEMMRHTHEFMDVEHNIEILKIRLDAMTDVTKLVDEHNQKMIDRGYAREEMRA